MESFTLVFGENVRGPICNNVTIINDDIKFYEFEEELSFNLSTTDPSVDLDPASGIMIISDEDSESFVVAVDYLVCVCIDETLSLKLVCDATLI